MSANKNWSFNIIVLRLVAAIFIAFSVSNSAQARYVAIGKISGSVCSGLVIEVCSFKHIEAVQDSSGQKYEINRVYENVSEYSKTKNMCWIKLKSGSISVDALNSVRRPEFLARKKDGKYEKVSPDYLVFSCKPMN